MAEFHESIGIRRGMNEVEENTCLEFVEFDVIGTILEEEKKMKEWGKIIRPKKKMMGKYIQYIQFRTGNKELVKTK